MKDIKELLNESIFDGEEANMKGLDDLIKIKDFYNKRRTKTPKELDMLSKELHEGDMVIAPNRGTPMPGIIMKIRNGAFAVCFTGDPEDMSRDASHDFRTNIGGYEIIKIDDDILKNILKIK